jgi:hypothetical protein
LAGEGLGHIQHTLNEWRRMERSVGFRVLGKADNLHGHNALSSHAALVFSYEGREKDHIFTPRDIVTLNISYSTCTELA